MSEREAEGGGSRRLSQVRQTRPGSDRPNVTESSRSPFADLAAAVERASEQLWEAGHPATGDWLDRACDGALAALDALERDMQLQANWHDRAEQGWADETARADAAEARSEQCATALERIGGMCASSQTGVVSVTAIKAVITRALGDV